MKRYYKIGELSNLYDIGVDSIRYYEKLGLITPKRSESGYRLYSARDIWRMNVIRDLRELGFSMEKIGDYLEDHSIEGTLNLLEEEMRSIERKQEALRRLKENVEQRIGTIETARHMPVGVCRLQEQPARRCFTLSEGYERDEEMDLLVRRLSKQDARHLDVVGSHQIGSVIPKDAALSGACRTYRAVFILGEEGEAELPAGQYLSLCYGGDYDGVEAAIAKMLDYAGAQNLELLGDFLEILWVDIHTSARAEEFITELQVRVQKKT